MLSPSHPALPLADTSLGATPPASLPAYWLGIDVGTSGARAIAIDRDGVEVASLRREFDPCPPEFWAALWQQTVLTLIAQLPAPIRHHLRAIAINGTSATVLLCDHQGHPLTAPLLYNDSRGAEYLDLLRAIAPADNPALSATSSLAKLLWWSDRILPPSTHDVLFLHQADWLAGLLHGQWGISDYHNALKLGYDVAGDRYPNWFACLPAPVQRVTLPRVVAPGTAIGPVQTAIAQSLDICPTCQICAGTTDSIAAFLASGAQQPGDAVTSLGSTLVLKLLSHTRVDRAEDGIYSHRLGNLWLVGGASNTGGAVLQDFFSPEAIAHLSQQIHPAIASPLDYYPLLKPGERFPVNDPHYPPRLSPRPADDVAFLHGLLESIARIEALGYERLGVLGASPLQRVMTAGGGAKNLAWQAIRDRLLPVPVSVARHTEAAYGSARLAQGTALPQG